MSLYAKSASLPKCHLFPKSCLLRAVMAPGRVLFEPRVLNPFPRRHYAHVLQTEGARQREGHATGSKRRDNTTEEDST